MKLYLNPVGGSLQQLRLENMTMLQGQNQRQFDFTRIRLTFVQVVKIGTTWQEM